MIQDQESQAFKANRDWMRWLRHEAPASSRQGPPPGLRWVFAEEEPVGFHLRLGRSFHFPW